MVSGRCNKQIKGQRPAFQSAALASEHRGALCTSGFYWGMLARNKQRGNCARPAHSTFTATAQVGAGRCRCGGGRRPGAGGRRCGAGRHRPDASSGASDNVPSGNETQDAMGGRAFPKNFPDRPVQITTRRAGLCLV